MNSPHCHCLVHYCSQIIAVAAGRYDNPGTDEPLCWFASMCCLCVYVCDKTVCIEQNVMLIFICDSQH